MILQQFQKVLQIDTQIAKMHAELLELYRERAQIIDSNNSDSLPPAPSQPELDFAARYKKKRLAKLRSVKSLAYKEVKV